MEAKRKPYPSNLSDVEWRILEPLVPRQGGPGAGRPAKHDLRDVLNGIFYVVRGGVAWRMIPSDLPPWETCYGYFYRWHKDGVWKRLNDALRDRVRAQVGKKSPYGCDP